MRRIKYEFENCLKRSEIHFTFNFLVILSLLGFCMECFAIYGGKMSSVRSSAESSMIQGTYSISILMMILILFPIISGVVFSDSLYTEYNSGVYKNILTKIHKKTYVLSKAVVVFFTTFLVVLIPLVLNQLLCFMFFPSEGFDNKYSLPPFDIGVQNFHKEYLFDFIRIQSPQLYIFVQIFVISLFASAISILTFSVYFFFLDKNRIVGVIVVFGLYVSSIIVFNVVGLTGYSLYDQLSPEHIGSFTVMIIWFLFILILSLILTIISGIKKEWEI
ncbi:ABC transporter permease [Bacillus sp. NPDC077027]|uniref:ABC transporter permease n=1 Tax=Bacillus sp. NPDC077027 TaxID=3390548 RepID=UPI003D08D92C